MKQVFPILKCTCVLALITFSMMNHDAQLFAESAGTGENQTPLRADLMIVVGAGGEASYQEMFLEWSNILKEVGLKANANVSILGPNLPQDSELTLKESIHQQLNAFAAEKEKPLWIALIGHGTYDGRDAKFNVVGPDISSDEFSEWMKPVTRPVAVMNTTSASAPFLNALSAPNRVVLTATKDGFELNFARFGSYLVKALGNPQADFDKDGQTSLLEAFIMASRRVGEFYEIEGRLASEHALLDDTGDQKGIQADWFKGVRPIKLPEGNAKPDGRTASQFHLIESELERSMSPDIKRRRDELEQAIFELRDHRGDMEEDAYFHRLESLLIPFAELYSELEESLDSKSHTP